MNLSSTTISLTCLAFRSPTSRHRSRFVAESGVAYAAGVEYEYRDAEYEYEEDHPQRLMITLISADVLAPV